MKGAPMASTGGILVSVVFFLMTEAVIRETHARDVLAPRKDLQLFTSVYRRAQAIIGFIILIVGMILVLWSI